MVLPIQTLKGVNSIDRNKLISEMENEKINKGKKSGAKIKTAKRNSRKS